MSKAKATVKVGGGKKSAKVAVKVAEAKPAADVKEKKEKKEKPEFNLAKALDENGNSVNLNEGRLTALPVNVPEGTKGLKRNSFSTKILYAQYQRVLLLKQQENLAKRLEDKDAEIVELKSGGDPKMKKVRRVKKLKAQVNALIAALRADGIDPEEMGIEA